MERSEPALVPEWLRGSGSLNAGISTLHLDDHMSSILGKSKASVNDSNNDSARSSGSSRNTSYFRRSSSSNGAAHVRSYNSFGRNQHDRDWEMDTYDSRSKDKSSVGNHRNRDSSDSLKNTLSSKFERDGLRRSQSMISGKHGDAWPKKISTDLGSSPGNKSSVSSGKKVDFDRDFPSLVAEERCIASEVGRVPSPGLSKAIHSLHFGTSASLGAEMWTSALAEVPLSVGSNATGSSVQQAAPTLTSVALGTSTNTSLNMAEAVAHVSKSSQNSQFPVGAQRLEELAIKQSRQLIPVTPAVPKILVSISEKQKSKVGPQQYPVTLSHPASNSPRGALAKADSSKASSVGKLHVLKPVRERNGTTPIVKENVSPTGGIRAASTTLSASAVSPYVANRSPPNKPILTNMENKHVLSNLEKLPTSQARSRKIFFDLMRKKSMATCSTIFDFSVANSSSVLENSTKISPSDKIPERKVVIASKTPPGIDNPSNLNHTDELNDNESASHCKKYIGNDKTKLSSDSIILDEEEAAFLRSLGWEENSDEGELTEEEINAFYKDVTKYINSNPSISLSRVQPKFLSPFNSQGGCMDEISSGLGSSEAKLES